MIQNLGSILGSGRYPGEGNGYTLQYSCLENPWTEEPDGVQYLGSQRVRQDWATKFSSVAQPSPTVCDPMDCSIPGLPVCHQLRELIQTHVHQVSDATQQTHPLLSPSPPAFNLSDHLGLCQWVISSHQVAKVLELQLQHQSLQRTLGWTGLIFLQS